MFNLGSSLWSCSLGRAMWGRYGGTNKKWNQVEELHNPFVIIIFFFPVGSMECLWANTIGTIPRPGWTFYQMVDLRH